MVNISRMESINAFRAKNGLDRLDELEVHRMKKENPEFCDYLLSQLDVGHRIVSMFPKLPTIRSSLKKGDKVIIYLDHNHPDGRKGSPFIVEVATISQKGLGDIIVRWDYTKLPIESQPLVPPFHGSILDECSAMFIAGIFV